MSRSVTSPLGAIVTFGDNRAETLAPTCTRSHDVTLSASMNLAERRDAIGASQQWLADEAGLGRSTIAMYESGSRSPSTSMARILAQILGITMDQFHSSWEESSA